MGRDIKFLSFQICEVTNLSAPITALVFVPSVFGEQFTTAEFWVVAAETACWEIEENNQIFNEDFYLSLYLPLQAIL